MARTSPDWSPESDDDYEIASSELKKRFAKWRAATGAEPEEDGGEGLLHYKWGYVDGHMTRWTCADLDEVYRRLHPAKVIVEEEELDEVLEEAKSFMTFVDETGLLDEDGESAEVLVGHLRAIRSRFRENMADTSLYSFGKRLFTSAGDEGVQIDDRASVEAFMSDFNARPSAERKAILGPNFSLLPARTGRTGQTGRTTPQGTLPRVSSSKRRKRRH